MSDSVEKSPKPEKTGVRPGRYALRNRERRREGEEEEEAGKRSERWCRPEPVLIAIAIEG